MKNSKNKKVKTEWELEIEKRIAFGIPNDEIRTFSGQRLPICSLTYKQDFLDIFTRSRRKLRKAYLGDADAQAIQNLYKKAAAKYTEYTFQQLEQAGGALELSKTCPYAHAICKNEVEFNDKYMMILYRCKDAVKSPDYPKKVIEVFKNNSKCRAVLYLFYKPLERKVLIEKDRNKIMKQREIKFAKEGTTLVWARDLF